MTPEPASGGHLLGWGAPIGSRIGPAYHHPPPGPQISITSETTNA
jgi:hypothetical protein